MGQLIYHMGPSPLSFVSSLCIAALPRSPSWLFPPSLELCRSADCLKNWQNGNITSFKAHKSATLPARAGMQAVLGVDGPRAPLPPHSRAERSSPRLSCCGVQTFFGMALGGHRGCEWHEAAGQAPPCSLTPPGEPQRPRGPRTRVYPG